MAAPMPDYQSGKITDFFIKLTRLESHKSLAWTYFGNLFYKANDKIVDSSKLIWFCNVCFQEKVDSPLEFKS